MLEDQPEHATHKGTPALADDIRNLVLLKMTEYGTMEVYPIDEAFNFRPTIRHKVYTLEEAEMMMSSKRKPRLASTLKVQFDAAEKERAKMDVEESTAKMAASNKSVSESGESDVEIVRSKKGRKKTKAAVNRSMPSHDAIHVLMV